MLVSTVLSGYWVGQAAGDVSVLGHTGAINHGDKAKVVRSILLPNFNNAIGIDFKTEFRNRGAQRWTSTPFAHHVRVLGVDSDARMAHATSVLLCQDGYHVLFVSTAQQALDILKNETPDVIIAEAEGGEISGHDLCAIVKTSERLQHIPVILTTTSALPSDYSTGRQLGAVVCMTRPCKPAQLRQAVHLVAPPPSQQSVYSAAFNMGSFVRTC